MSHGQLICFRLWQNFSFLTWRTPHVFNRVLGARGLAPSAAGVPERDRPHPRHVQIQRGLGPGSCLWGSENFRDVHFCGPLKKNRQTGSGCPFKEELLLGSKISVVCSTGFLAGRFTVSHIMVYIVDCNTVLDSFYAIP